MYASCSHLCDGFASKEIAQLNSTIFVLSLILDSARNWILYLDSAPQQLRQTTVDLVPDHTTATIIRNITGLISSKHLRLKYHSRVVNVWYINRMFFALLISLEWESHWSLHK